MLSRLTEMVCRRLREHELYARTVHIKLRYSDFSTFTRAQTLERPTQLDAEVLEATRRLFRANWRRGQPLRLLGVHAGDLSPATGRWICWMPRRRAGCASAMGAVDALRDRFGEKAVSLASGMKARFRERTHENPAALPGKEPRKKRQD